MYTKHNLNHLLKDTLPVRRGPYYSPLLSTSALTARGSGAGGPARRHRRLGMVQVSVPQAPEVWGTFPRQHLPLFSRHLIALENFFHWKRSSEVRSLIPMPTTYQQSVSERGTPNPAGHEEGAGAPALPQENGGLLQLTRLFSKLSQLLAVQRSEIPLPSQDKFWDVKDPPFPKSRQEVSISPKLKSRQTAMLSLNTCRKLNLGYLWWYMKLILKWL